MCAVLISCLLGVLLLFGVNRVPFAGASSDIYQGNLVLTGSNVTVIEGRFDINGSILIEENATLILNDAILNFTSGSVHSITLQNPVNGNPRFVANNATIIRLSTSRFYDNGTLSFSNCSISGPGGFYFNDKCNVTVLDSIIEKNFQVRDFSRALISNSTIKRLELVTYTANCTIENLNPGFYDYWDFWLNCSVAVGPFGRSPDVVLNQTLIEAWNLSFQASSYAEISGSSIWQLHENEGHAVLSNSTVHRVELYGSSMVELVNSSYVQTDLSGASAVSVSWYLSVSVVDSWSQTVPLANVTVAFPNATLTDSKLSDENGSARFTLLEKMMNATGAYPVGNYTVNASYAGYSDGTTLNLTTSAQITLMLDDFIIPELPLPLILTLFTATTLLVIMAKRRKYPNHSYRQKKRVRSGTLF
jgi:hypothetical protein